MAFGMLNLSGFSRGREANWPMVGCAVFAANAGIRTAVLERTIRDRAEAKEEHNAFAQIYFS
jgi:hypothetical protein